LLDITSAIVFTDSLIGFAGLTPVVATVSVALSCGGGPTRHSAAIARTATINAGIPSRTTALLATPDLQHEPYLYNGHP